MVGIVCEDVGVPRIFRPQCLEEVGGESKFALVKSISCSPGLCVGGKTRVWAGFYPFT